MTSYLVYIAQFQESQDNYTETLSLNTQGGIACSLSHRFLGL